MSAIPSLAHWYPDPAGKITDRPLNPHAHGAPSNVIADHWYPIQIDAGTSEGVKKSWEKRHRGAGAEPTPQLRQRAAKTPEARHYNPAQLKSLQSKADAQYRMLQQAARGDPEAAHRAEGAKYVMHALKFASEHASAIHSVDIGPSGTPVAAGVMLSDGYIPYVGASERGRGKVVMRGLIQQARDAGLKKMTLSSLPGAVDFYKKIGFKAQRSKVGNLTEMVLDLSKVRSAALDMIFDALAVDDDLEPYVFTGDVEFREEEHPRDEEGKFTEGGMAGAAPRRGTAKPVKAPVKPVRIEDVPKIAHDLAVKLGYDPRRIQMMQGRGPKRGGVGFGRPIGLSSYGGLIRIFLGELKEYEDDYGTGKFGNMATGLIAHEIQHQKFNAIITQDYEDEKQAGGGPTYNAIHDLYEGKNKDQLIKTDGVSLYSELYWDEYFDRPVDPKYPKMKEFDFERAVNETLSEIANIEHKGVDPDEAKPVPKVWKDLYDTINKLYKERYWGGTGRIAQWPEFARGARKTQRDQSLDESIAQFLGDAGTSEGAKKGWEKRQRAKPETPSERQQPVQVASAQANILQAYHEGGPLPRDVDRKWKELADAQRGEPEFAMLQVQKVLGGGLLSVLVEHIGDITNRISKTANEGHVGGEEKVLRGINLLDDPYGFERQHEENLKNNQEFLEEKGLIPKGEYRKRLNDALFRYAAAHARLPVYNKLQYMAREAAVAIGQQDWDSAREYLHALRPYAEDKEKWTKAGLEYTKEPDGSIAQYFPEPDEFTYNRPTEAQFRNERMRRHAQAGDAGASQSWQSLHWAADWGDAGTSEGARKGWLRRQRAAPETQKQKQQRTAPMPKPVNIWHPLPALAKGRHGNEYVRAQLKDFATKADLNASRLKRKWFRTPNPENRHLANAAEFVTNAIQNAADDPKNYFHAIDVGPDGTPTAAAVLNKKEREIEWVGSIERGHGKAVMRDLLRQAKEAGLQEVTLHATQSGLPLYKKLGFQGEEKDRFGLVPMKLNLAEAVLDAAFDALGEDEDIPLVGNRAIANVTGGFRSFFDALDEAEFKEEQHPRDEGGKFTEKGTGATSVEEQHQRDRVTEWADNNVKAFGLKMTDWIDTEDKFELLYEDFDGTVVKLTSTGDEDWPVEWEVTRNRKPVGKGKNARDLTKILEGYGHEREKPPPPPAWKDRWDIYGEEITRTARNTAMRMGYDPNKIEFSDESPTFMLNGKERKTAGEAVVRGPDKGKIIFYKSEMSEDFVGVAAAHEVMHQKWNTVFDDFEEEDKAQIKEIDELIERTPFAERRTDEFVDKMKAVSRKYRTFNWLRKYFQDYNTEKNLRKTDGVTDYSRDYWKAVETGEGDVATAVDETLAEIAFIEHAKATENSYMLEARGATEPAPVWRNFYDTVNRAYKQKHWYSRSVVHKDTALTALDQQIFDWALDANGWKDIPVRWAVDWGAFDVRGAPWSEEMVNRAPAGAPGGKGGEFQKKGTGGAAGAKPSSIIKPTAPSLITPSRGLAVPSRELAVPTWYKGESIATHIGPRGRAPVILAPATARVFKGAQVMVPQISKQAAGKIGEHIALAWIQDILGYVDAAPANLQRSNFPIDIVGDDMVFEVKTGQVSNTKNAQHWRATIGEAGDDEKEYLKTLSGEKKKEYNDYLMVKIMDRKEWARDQYAKLTGRPISAKTITLIINPSTGTADIHAFDGFWEYIGWKRKDVADAFQGTFKYTQARDTGEGRERSGAKDRRVSGGLAQGFRPSLW